MSVGFTPGRWIGLGSTTTTVSGPSTGIYPNSYSFTATVSSSSGFTPKGTIDWYDGASFITTTTLNSSGQSTISYAPSNGSHSIIGYYTPSDGMHLASNGSWGITIYLPSSTSIVLLGNPVQYGATQVLRATVSSAYGTPTGSVDFYVGGSYVGTASLSGGVADLNIGNSRNVGSYAIQANYAGSSSFASSSGSNSFTINKADVTVTITGVAPNPSMWGCDPFIVSYSISTSTGVAFTGTSTFSYNNIFYGSFGESGSFGGSFGVGSQDISTIGTLNWRGSTAATSNFNASPTSGAYAHTQNKQSVAGVNVTTINSSNNLPNTINNPNPNGGFATIAGEVGFGCVVRAGTTVRLMNVATNTTIATTTLNGSGQFTFSTNAIPGGSPRTLRVDYDGDSQTDAASGSNFGFYQS